MTNKPTDAAPDDEVPPSGTPIAPADDVAGFTVQPRLNLGLQVGTSDLQNAENLRTPIDPGRGAPRSAKIIGFPEFGVESSGS